MNSLPRLISRAHLSSKHFKLPSLVSPALARSLTTIQPSNQTWSNSSSKSFLGAFAASLLVGTSIAVCDAQEKGKKAEDFKLYQYRICPFCNRVKAYLDFLKIPYEAIEVNPLTKSEIKFSKEYKKVPIALLAGNDDLSTQTIADSKLIIDYITDNFVKGNPSINPSFIASDSDYWNEWSEKKLAVLLYPNITRSFEESFECFNYSENVEQWNVLERKAVHWVGAVAMLGANGKIKKKYNIVDEREDLFKILTEWTDAVGDKPFLHGDSVTLPDLLVYGVLRSIESFRTFNDIMAKNSELSAWYQRVAKQVNH